MKSSLTDAADPFGSWWPIIISLLVGVIATIRHSEMDPSMKKARYWFQKFEVHQRASMECPTVMSYCREIDVMHENLMKNQHCKRSYFGGPNCPSEATIKGKTVVITGGSNGVGLEVVAELFRRGGRIIIGSRNTEAAAKAVAKVIGKEKIVEDLIIIKYLDLTSLKSVREFVKALNDEAKIDILINNAGIAFNEFKKTEEGFETHLVTNYLSHFLLTHLLLPKLKAAEEARIINVSAQAHYVADLFLDDMNIENNYTYNTAFGQSKLALVMMAKHLQKLLKGTNVTINAMHPGIVRSTKQFTKSPFSTSRLMKIVIAPWAWLLTKTPQQGAQTIIYMAVATEFRNTSGKYFSNCKIVDPSEKALDEGLAETLYKKSLELVGLNEKDDQKEVDLVGNKK